MKEAGLIVLHRKKRLAANPSALYHKLHDAAGLSGRKPFDVFIIDRGRTEAIEFKIHKTHRAFPLSKIQPHQIRGLQLAARNGATATVYIGVRFLMDVDTQERLQLRLRRINVDLEYPIDEIVQMLEEGKKGIPILPLLKKAINGEP